MKLLEQKQKEGSVIELTLSLPWSEFKTFEQKAIDAILAETELDGFRKGTAPRDLIVKHVGDATVLREMSEKAIAYHYPRVVTEAKIDAIGYPNIRITKLARENDLELVIETAILPIFTLPDYKTLAKNQTKESHEATDEDVERTIGDILKMKARQDHMKNHEHKEGESCDQDHENLPLPELTDALTQELGQFESVTDFKNKLKVSISEEKALRARDKHRITIIDSLMKETTIELPQILIDSEVSQMINETRAQIEQMGMKFADYLAHMKKTEQDLRGELQKDAADRVKAELILDGIRKQEKLTPDPKEIDEKVTILKDKYQDVEEVAIRNYVENMLSREKVLTFLETIS